MGALIRFIKPVILRIFASNLFESPAMFEIIMPKVPTMYASMKTPKMMIMSATRSSLCVVAAMSP